ncbi:DNA polymerase III subunit gamma and tau [Nocardioides marmorisolisilvae]|uniref:DNA polymerase III subunit gamma/tau n=1 Tax=Nocardioides marmorisolisilvae TaxID=1542737 RepID=A0A3N0E0E4_9ACTN|nr:DNA polymerase III subunit gamma and tau [Nocardioides marmorisolisilvae]RNL81322.1 DNA polymerase III subunit gamma and tau [Nocardioides marmorisolisilvae]
MEHNLALYRRYRPESFAEVIGQDHVTEPLRAALAGNRVNHAYLFSGPRGCGKTTSARILARTLNCEKAPVADPCGECQSCRDLARGGPGSLDVIEIDAASHGGVDDARDLRERAFFAPVSSRYKVYIIDEAHMVSSQGFNALLKLVEEPPEHLKFIFATTEPEKVIPTIRSRTHHYPFRLIPPRVLSDYLGEICQREGVPIEPAALPLVVRAGAGSARDSLSVLDQLLGGAGAAGLTYDLAAGLLGYTPDTLLDEVVDAFAAGDGSTVFSVVDKVIETGQDPRRFTEDLLRRLRDLVIVAAVPDAPATGLIDVPQDQAERLVAQAARFGKADLVRSADCVAAGLTEMRGATTPRLLLELICARVLLPGADDSLDGLGARLDRLERRVGVEGVLSGAPAPAAPPPAPVVEVRAPASLETPEDAAPTATGFEAPASAAAPQPTQEAPTEPSVVEPVETPAAEAPSPPVSSSGGLGLVDARRVWPDVLEKVKEMRRFTWILLSQNAQVIGLDGGVLTVGFKNAGAKDSFIGGGSEEILRQAAIDVIGVDWKVEAIVDPSADPGAGTAPVVTKAATTPVEPAPVEPAPVTEAPAAEAPAVVSSPPAWVDTEETEDAADAVAEPPAPEPVPVQRAAPETIASARSNIAPTRSGEAPTKVADTRDDDVHPDDPDVDDSGVDGAELLARELGATVVEEIPHD